MTRKRCLWIFSLLAGWPLFSATAINPVQVSLVAQRSVAAAGDRFDVGVLFEIAPGWHIYGKDPGESGLPTEIHLKLPSGFKAEAIRWPTPQTFSFMGASSQGYEGRVLFPIRIQVPSTGRHSGQSAAIEAEVSWLACEKSCVPGSAKVTVHLRMGRISMDSSPEILSLFESQKTPASKPPPPPPVQPSPDGQNALLWHALLAALVGGLILNLMPCVLPVLAIKIMHFVNQAGQETATPRKLSLFYALGVIFSFWLLTALIGIFRLIGQEAGWGFQFQNPVFLIFMAYVLTLVSLNLFGIFEFTPPIHLPQGISAPDTKGPWGALFSGILATLLATPCTAPFVSTAAAFAFSQPLWQSFLVLTTMGLGLALPTVALSWNPRLLKRLPKPGAWMLHFKQAMGFPILATVLWLLWILIRSASPDSAMWTAGWLLLAAFGIWLVNILRPCHFGWLTATIAFFAFAGYFTVAGRMAVSTTPTNIHATTAGISWRPFSRQALDEALKTSQPVFVDFTADWCITCQANKRTAIETHAVATRFRDLGVIPLLADWTRPNEEIRQALKSHGRAGVPLYLLFPADRQKPPVILPELLTEGLVLQALEAAGSSGNP
ncbi:MAG: protein-disulfide reductase DsbD family protein [Verrucomicrobiae bacterium]|nr:protein-disulfide reductase DsbD family protein [Verrucomicrobiae bacterium]